ncbi:MAG: hypothetical protein JWN81_1083, partial [Solirubrobacterales bacterium]|nr:hypothetical protein [Solirubrobacterales bacterium]
MRQSDAGMDRRETRVRAGLAAIGCALIAAFAGAAPAAARVLHVGRYNGSTGSYKTIQQAVNAANPGDWILIGPGDYKDAATTVPTGPQGDDRAGAAVLLTKPGVHIRGMDRNGVVLDGTKPGTPPCSSAAADQNLGPLDERGVPTGRNGLIVFKAQGTSVENLTACNFLTGSGGGGDELWFDGGAASGTQQLGSWRGAYLSATSTYYAGKTSPFV